METWEVQVDYRVGECYVFEFPDIPTWDQITEIVQAHLPPELTNYHVYAIDGNDLTVIVTDSKGWESILDDDDFVDEGCIYLYVHESPEENVVAKAWADRITIA